MPIETKIKFFLKLTFLSIFIPWFSVTLFGFSEYNFIPPLVSPVRIFSFILFSISIFYSSWFLWKKSKELLPKEKIIASLALIFVWVCFLMMFFANSFFSPFVYFEKVFNMEEPNTSYFLEKAGFVLDGGVAYGLSREKWFIFREDIGGTGRLEPQELDMTSKDTILRFYRKGERKEPVFYLKLATKELLSPMYYKQ